MRPDIRASLQRCFVQVMVWLGGWFGVGSCGPGWCVMEVLFVSVACLRLGRVGVRCVGDLV